MKYISLQQDYKEIIALENLLLDCQRRLILADEMDLIEFRKNDEIRIVGGGFSALLTFHALRFFGKITGIYDPSAPPPNYDLPGVTVLPLEELSLDSKSPVLVACAPGMAEEIMVQVAAAAPNCNHILLFSPNDSVNSVEHKTNTNWTHLNMSYRCVNIAVNMARRYRPVSLDVPPSPVFVMGSNLAGLLAQFGMSLCQMEFAGYANQDNVSPDADLLVTVAPETFSQKERTLCNGITCRSAQFLFRKGDNDIPALTMDGFTGCRLLGAGEEGYVFDAIGPDSSRYCYKRFYEVKDRTKELEWIRSFSDGPSCMAWMGNASGIPDKRAKSGICYPYIKLGHIPFMDESRNETLNATVAYCLQFQQAHIFRGRVPATMPGGIHALCDEKGSLRFVDIGNYPPPLSECKPDLVKRAVIKGLAGLTHETIFSGKGWKNLESEESLRNLSERLNLMQEVLPKAYLNLLREALALPAEAFIRSATYRELAQKYTFSVPVLPADVVVRAHNPAFIPAPGPVDLSKNEAWFQERLYQSYRYRYGSIEGAGATGAKYALIADTFEQMVADSSYLDIGSNMGFFVGRAALFTEKPCHGLEKRGEFRLQTELMFQTMGIRNAEVKHVHLKPSYSLPEYDVVSAFAVIHHIYLMDGAFQKFTDMIDYIAKATKKALLIEYVHNPGYIERAAKRHGRAFTDYNEAGLITALAVNFPTVEKIAEISANRVIYLATRKR